MATEYIYKICQNCNGDGEWNDTPSNPDPENPEIAHSCEPCSGVGRILWGEVRDELISEE